MFARSYGNSIIILVPSDNGKFAVFNNARELCGIIDNLANCVAVWHPINPKRNLLEELGLT